MPDSVTTEVFLDFNVPAISQGYDDGLLKALAEAAQMGLDKSKSIFQRKTQNTGTGHMEETFFEFKSFFKDGGWVFGVGDKSGNWEDSTAGRAHFFEYGRSAPGMGRKSTGKAAPIKWRAQPPRPFIRPARNAVKRALGGITSKELRSIAIRMNRNSDFNRAVMSAVNKIA